MKAIVRDRYGSPAVLQLAEMPKPTPAEDELLIKIKATSLNSMDWRLLRANPFFVRLMGLGFFKPKTKVLGHDIAGVVEAVGANVTEFKPGDAVFGFCDGGGLAEYVCAKQKGIVHKPENATFEEASAIPTAAITALQGLRDAGKLTAGQTVLIHGASGGVGMFAVQLANDMGAVVTAVCSTRNVELARSFGAHHVIDYKKEDFTDRGERYDLIFAVNGNRSIFDYRKAVGENGRYISAGGGIKQLLQPMILGKYLSQENGRSFASLGTTHVNQEDLKELKNLLEAGKISPSIDQCYSLEDTAEAMWYMEEKHPQGKVVISQPH